MNKNKFLVRGSVGLMAIVVVAVLVIGGGAYLVMKKSPEQKVTQVEQSASDIGASFPSLDFSLSSYGLYCSFPKYLKLGVLYLGPPCPLACETILFPILHQS